MDKHKKTIKQLQYILIHAKVDLEYGMGFSKNPYLLACREDIEKALDLVYTKNKSKNSDTKG